MKEKIKKIVEYTIALIYCRVSGKRQKVEGGGLESQEYRCRAYATSKGYEVERVFKDDYTGGGDFMNRPAMSAILAYMDCKPHVNYVVIFDDLKRFARDTEFHFKLKKALQARKAKPECLNFQFGDEPEDEFVETIMAAQNQLERKQNRRQVIQKMKACVERGHWPFNPPKGLKNVKVAGRGKVLMSEEPFASVYKEAIEKFRDLKLNGQEEVRKFILLKYSERGIDLPLSLHGVNCILTEPLYCGHLEYEPWEVSFRKADHDGFITLDTHLAVQQRLADMYKPKVRVDTNADFPLRNYLFCPLCKKRVTGSWHKGKMGKLYPHYWCKTVGCPLKDKSLNRDTVGTDFLELLQSVVPKPEVMEVAEMVLTDLWSQRQELELVEQKRMAKEADKLQADADIYKAKMIKAKNDLLAEEYERDIVKILEKKAGFVEKSNRKMIYPPKLFGTSKRIVFEVIKNPLSVWKNGNYEDKRLLLNMYFRRGVAYDKKTGFGTLTLPLVLKVLSSPNTTEKALVDKTCKVWHEFLDYLNMGYGLLERTKNITFTA